MNLIIVFGARGYSIRGIYLPIVLLTKFSVMYKLKTLILEIRGKQHNIFLIHSVRRTINCVLEKLLVFPVIETFIITPCRIYGKYDYAKCCYQMISH